MKEERYFFVPDAVQSNQLPEEEALHAVRVLRLKEGDAMVLMDGQGTFYEAEVTLASQRRCHYVIRQTLPQQPQWRGHLHLAMAPTKMMERTEWLAEKATEVGFDELSLLDCRFSERRTVKLPRIEKIVVAAVKQSRKAWMPRLNGMQPFDSFIEAHADGGRRFIAHCYDEVPRTNLFDELCHAAPDDDVLVLVGPEGDFSIDEVHRAVAAGFVSVDLGKSRLRTETAALSAVMMMQLAKQITN
ncbi:MAG: 16S rRNA (uracil(1498)-N(3))-methyltransferase [Prevotella sp.]|nr:16S rRNA (uracil(1498)-N(3))-methyltransferase [Prevotella sp.]